MFPPGSRDNRNRRKQQGTQNVSTVVPSWLILACKVANASEIVSLESSSLTVNNIYANDMLFRNCVHNSAREEGASPYVLLQFHRTKLKDG